MSNLIKASIDLFIAIAVIVAFVQDIWRIPTAASPDALPTQSNTTLLEQFPQIAGVLIKATDNLRKPVTDFLIKEEYNVQVEPYTFEGQQWWKETFLTYGHMLIVYILMGKYKSETNQSTKSKIMFGGAALVMGWMFLSPYLKDSRVTVEVNGVKKYDHASVMPNEFIEAITDSGNIENQDSEFDF